MKDSVTISIVIGAKSKLLLTIDPFASSDGEKITASLVGEKVDASYVQFLSIIIEAAKAMISGMEINRFFNPVPENKRVEIEYGKYPKFKWTRRGSLRFMGMSEKKFMHSNSIPEALSRKGVFTASNEIAQSIPLKKED